MRFPTLVRRGIERPIVPVRVEAPDGGWTLVDALVDMGADVSLFPISVARSLGIDLSHVADSAVGTVLGTQARYRSCVLFLELRRPPDTFRWKGMIGFVPQPMNYGILGSRGFFEFFTVHYNLHEHWLDIEPSGPLPQ